MSTTSTDDILSRVERLNAIGVALSAERNLDRLLEMILDGAQEITNADGGTLYTKEGDKLKFEILHTKSLGLIYGGTSGKPVPFYPVTLHSEEGEPNLQMVSAYAVLKDETINIPDAYDAEGFDFSGTKSFDEKTGYRSMSFLTLPMKNHQGDIIGVLQLLNAKDPASGETIPFSQDDQRFAESLASQAAVALTNNRLIEDQKQLFDSFIQLIASAIDEKSPYTGGHCERVPMLTMMLAEAVHETGEGPFADFNMSDDDRYELKIAGWLHDCGKVTTPEYVVDKATKLETIFDRINLVKARFEVLKREVMIDALSAALKRHSALDPQEVMNSDAVKSALAQLEDDLAFVEKANVGGEFMDQGDQERVRQIGSRSYSGSENEGTLLSENEIYNLSIAKGTLTPEEREVINNHIVMTIKMLESLPYPKHLKRVPEFAGGHHERMDGNGYPKGLKRDDMSVQARVMGIADIFEALTARDRPYKPGKTLSESLRILGFMKEDNHIDPDLFDIFVRKKVYKVYAEKFLPPDQIDTVDESKIPGYTP